jgi:hypothetical protein
MYGQVQHSYGGLYSLSETSVKHIGVFESDSYGSGDVDITWLLERLAIARR